MNSPRPILFFAVLVVGFFLWQAWEQDYAAKPAASVAARRQFTGTREQCCRRVERRCTSRQHDGVIGSATCRRRRHCTG
jgi:hypothetical protein